MAPASLKRALGSFARQIAILKPSKISTKPVDIFCGKLKSMEVG
jgi:hypothetical protein